MREKYYGLLREYLDLQRERDLYQALCRKASESVEREEAGRKLELARKRSKALLREIRRYPDVNILAAPGASNDPTPRYAAQAGS